MAKKEQNEFEIARKKRRRKISAQRARKFIGGALIIALLCTGIYFFIREDVAGIIGDRIASASSGENSLPVDLSGVTVLDTFAVGEHMGMLTDAVYCIYAENGKLLLSKQHYFANPVVEAAGRRFLIYDQGGTGLIVRTRDKVLFEKEFEYKIISADISADGMLSVVTAAQRYASQLHVFEETYQEEIFTWSASDEYIICASANGGENTVAAASLFASETGEMITAVHVFTTEAAVELGKHEFKGASVLSLEYDSNGDIKVICDTVAAVLDKNANLLGSRLYQNIPTAGINLPGVDGAVVIFDRFTESRATDIMILNENFSEPETVSVSGKYICSDGAENRFAVYCSGTANVFSNSGERTAVLEGEQDALLIELMKESVLAITRDQLCKIEN